MADTRALTCLFLLCVFVLTTSGRKGKAVDNQDLAVEETLVGSKNETWTEWSHCNHRCRQSRTRLCPDGDHDCRNQQLKQKRSCWKPRGRCAKETRMRRYRGGRMGGLEDLFYDMLYDTWSEWSACTRSCVQRRYRSCAVRYWCRDVVLVEERACNVIGSRCQELESEDAPEEDDSMENLLQGRKKNKNAKKRNNKKKDRKTTEGKLDETVLNSLNDICGLRNVTTRSLRIVGGQQSIRGAWPWQVAILTRWKEQYCGGVLISPRHVLTAAHCLKRKNKRRHVIVRTGEFDIAIHEGPEEDFRSPRDIIHPGFDLETIDSDIAIITLPREVNISEEVQFACIPKATDVLPANTLCYAVGWGKVRDTRLFGEDVLREARVPLVETSKCQSAFDYEITKNQMCAGYRRGGVDTCAGDSGGPLMCEIEKKGQKRWYVYGVTSFGEGCGDRGKYGIYTRVSNFAGWIRNNIKK